MKAKNKTLALLEIAFVLCSTFLVATLPAIAAEQNTITTTSEDDYVLGVYGNANEDDTIDMRDLTYVKLIFFGKKPETELSDAKYDGKINPLDFIQIKLIIVGKEKELTFVDARGDVVTANEPIKRIVLLNGDLGEAIRVLHAEDRVAGVTESIKKCKNRLPVISETPSVGGWYTPDIEAILMQKPDTVCVYGKWPKPEMLEDKLPSGINVIRLDFYIGSKLRNEMKILGYLLGEVENADEYIKWHDTVVDEIESRVSKVEEDEKVDIFIDGGGGKKFGRRAYSTGTGMHDLCVLAGGRDIAEGYVSGYADVETEWILEQDQKKGLDAIVGITYVRAYETDDNTKMKEHYDEILGLPGFNNVTAVANNRVYIISNSFAFGPHYPAALATIAKWFYPNRFKDLNPTVIHQEYLNKYLRIDLDVTKHGVFTYPSLAG